MARQPKVGDKKNEVPRQCKEIEKVAVRHWSQANSDRPGSFHAATQSNSSYLKILKFGIENSSFLLFCIVFKILYMHITMSNSFLISIITEINVRGDYLISVCPFLKV